MIIQILDCIYAVGGFDGSTGLNSAEKLDLTLPSPTVGYPDHEASRRRR